MQVVVSPRLGNPPPFSVQEALPLPYGKGSQESPRRSSLSDAAHPPQPDRSSPSLTADSNTSSTVRSDLSEAGRLRTDVRQWGGAEMIHRYQQHTGEKKTAHTHQESETNNGNCSVIYRVAPKRRWERSALVPNELQPERNLPD